MGLCGMAVSLLRVLRGACIAFAMLLGRGAVGFSGVFMMRRRFRVRLLGHNCFLVVRVRAETRRHLLGSSQSRQNADF
jgi:hypothetical protein